MFHRVNESKIVLRGACNSLFFLVFLGFDILYSIVLNESGFDPACLAVTLFRWDLLVFYAVSVLGTQISSYCLHCKYGFLFLFYFISVVRLCGETRAVSKSKECYRT